MVKGRMQASAVNLELHSARTHHSLPQDQTLGGAGVDLQLDSLW